MPEHAVGLLFPAGWASSLVDTLLDLVCTVLGVDDKNAPLSHMHMQAAGRHLVCPLSKWYGAGRAVPVSGSQAAGWLGWQGRAGPRGILVYCVYCCLSVCCLIGGSGGEFRVQALS